MQVNERVICLRTHEEKLFSDGKIMETHWGREKGFVRKAQLDKYDSCTRSRAHPLQTKKKSLEVRWFLTEHLKVRQIIQPGLSPS